MLLSLFFTFTHLISKSVLNRQITEAYILNVPGMEPHRQEGCLMWLEVAALRLPDVRVRVKDES